MLWGLRVGQGWRVALLSLLREPRLKPPQGPAGCVVQIFKRGDRASQEEASASCQKLTGTPPFPASPSLFQTARGWRQGSC